ncbi:MULTISPECIES: hypothetical protein [Weissella]|uniref:hypothetical protein n=1 Tax=Weissella TaxID=46255 RepID=UPI00189A72FC|nr:MULTISPECIES: hypothetical protein [Weissella]EGP5052903.1 hypothetical protein [Enterococcus faecium]MBJ7644058.1 hypothetical protein [Weissella confusa]MCT8400041.1 hypothetical protein [Weissella cibaria]HAQ0322877.1 hypothetical protein [Enterococcus faecium]
MSDQLEKLLAKREKAQKRIEIEELKIRQYQYIENKKARKARTRKLIQKGALLDKYFETESLSADETESLLKIFANYVNSNKPDKYKKDSPE